MNFMVFSSLVLLSLSSAHGSPYQNFFRNPYFSNYANQIPTYTPFVPTFSDFIDDPSAAAYLSTPDILPTLNVLAEIPYAINNRFTVVPMLVVSRDNMHLVSNAQIASVSTRRPVMTVRTAQDALLQCTPAVRIVLPRPIAVFSLRTSVLFPDEVLIRHGAYSIPIRVGAIVAPVAADAFVSAESPVAVTVVYAVPTRPVRVDYVNNDGVLDLPDNQAIVVESEEALPPKNVTIIEFPDREAEPVLQVDETDDELVNRNPPIFIAPAGIVQSTQPQYHTEPFTNSKESPVLIALREEAKKRI